MGGDPITHAPERGPVAPDAVRVTLRLEDGPPVPGSIQLAAAGTQEADGDEAEFSGLMGSGTLTARTLRFPV